ncbi:hypothetical protein QX220_22595, partial [Vibrio vulnificus]|uniref:hypothetical protein n=1 Tax=Vibrio vulnificus TaxID=672 RepID=UPI00287AB490
ISLKIRVTFSQWHVSFISNSLDLPNAQLRGEQRPYPNLKHCAINTKLEVEAKMPSVVNPS